MIHTCTNNYRKQLYALQWNVSFILRHIILAIFVKYSELTYFAVFAHCLLSMRTQKYSCLPEKGSYLPGAVHSLGSPVRHVVCTPHAWCLYTFNVPSEVRCLPADFGFISLPLTLRWVNQWQIDLALGAFSSICYVDIYDELLQWSWTQQTVGSIRLSAERISTVTQFDWHCYRV
jgi:hypothetical protein